MKNYNFQSINNINYNIENFFQNHSILNNIYNNNNNFDVNLISNDENKKKNYRPISKREINESYDKNKNNIHLFDGFKYKDKNVKKKRAYRTQRAKSCEKLYTNVTFK